MANISGYVELKNNQGDIRVDIRKFYRDIEISMYFNTDGGEVTLYASVDKEELKNTIRMLETEGEDGKEDNN